MADEFKPNIYPIMYWGLVYGLAAAFLLFIVFLLSRYLTLVWFPVFLAGVIWGGYRNYKKQKTEGATSMEKKAPMEEIKDAARDIIGATKEVIAEQVKESVEREDAEQTAAQAEEKEMPEEAVRQSEAIAPAEVTPSAEGAVLGEEESGEKKSETFDRPGPPPPATQ